MSKEANIRCNWCRGDPLMLNYHDQEWGVLVHHDRDLFEMLVLEGAQAGLSWATILKRREGYREAFENFDIKTVASFTEVDLNRLLANKKIIRNKLKIKSAINNAQQVIKVQKEFGSFDKYIWGFVDYKQIQNKFDTLSKIPASTPLSEKISKDMKKRGFTFVGPTICYAFMQSIGLVNDHILTCYRYKEIQRM